MKIFQEKLNLFLAAFFAIIVSAIVAIFFSSLYFPESSYNFIGKSKDIRLSPEEPVTQIFGAKRDNLNGIDISLDNMDKMQLEERINIALSSEDCQTAIREENIDRSTYIHKFFYRFRFSAIQESSGKKFCLRMTFNSPNGYKGKKSDLPTVESSPISRSENVPSYGIQPGEEKQEKSLVIRPTYQNMTFLENLKELTNRLSQFKPDFLKDWSLAIIFSLAICLSFMIILVLLFL